MKLPENMYNKEEIKAIKEAKIEIDFSKEYTAEEFGDIEIKLKDACLCYGFTNCKPNDKCAMWERICDVFIEVTDELIP